MARTRQESEQIKQFIIANVDESPTDIARITAARFGLSRQSVVRHLNQLVERQKLQAFGRTKARRYALQATTWITTIEVHPQLEEDVVWREQIAPRVGDLPENVRTICNFGFTEMLNNVRDHSESVQCSIGVSQDPIKTTLSVHDMGVGIFNKIQRTFGLLDPRHALLELSKGKLTTDSKRHSGEGVFFTSRMFDEFRIISGNMFYRRINRKDDEWFIDVGEQPAIQGTTIVMTIRHDAEHTVREVYDKYASEDHDYGFARTHVPIQLAMYEGEQMLSRSQAKRILARVERFREVILDYSGVTEIGQAFADEIYRVFSQEHPGVNIISVFTTPEIDRMITHVTAGQVAAEPIDSRQLPLLSPADAQESTSLP